MYMTPLRVPPVAGAPTALRQVLVLCHRYVGLAIVPFLIVAGLTGSIMSFQHEIDAWLNPDLFHVESRGLALSPTHLVERIEAQEPRVRVSYVPIAVAAGDSVRLSIRPKTDPATGQPYTPAFNQVFADPVTGTILGTREAGTAKFDRHHFVPFIIKLHYSLHMPGSWGIWLFGGVALLWFVDCLVAMYLTFPRGRPFFRKWRIAWQVKPKRLNFDLHRAGGLWFWLVLPPLALSSVYLNLYSEVFKPLVAAFSPITPSPYDERSVRSEPPAPAYDYDRALALAGAAGAARGFSTPVGSIGYNAERGFYFAIYYRDQYTPADGLGSPRIYLDDQSGAVISTRVPGEGTAGDIFTQAQFPLHTGQVMGLPGRILICLTGLIVAMLSVTGATIWLRKRQARHVRNVRARA